MDPRQLTRNAEAVLKTIVVDKKVMMTKTGCTIYIPARYVARKLATIGLTVETLGFFAIVVDGHYAVSKACASMPFTPSTSSIVTMGDADYYELQFDKGAVICPNVDLVVKDSIAYYINDEFISKGRVPWWHDEEDQAKLFVTSGYHAGVNIGPSNVIMEMIVASTIRLASDRTVYYRHAVNSLYDKDRPASSVVPLRSAIYGATNTVARILGSYFDDNLTSALGNPSEHVEGFETVLRQ